ncbi:MAG TPA: polysaccharide biosynthesis/export family protein [Gemmatimonadales bacterium]|nr:polysaccharide biosynthesis/export family protein [Gemmatimonadales bacterium]
MRPWITAWVTVVAVTLPPRAAALAAGLQDTGRSMADRTLAPRDSLEALAAELGQESAAPAAALLERVQQRLREGDFRPGDRILITVHGEPALSDTFTVGPDRQLQLPPPVVGSLPLRGVLRAEVEQVLRDFVSQFVRQPVMRVDPLVRLAVQGEVAHAGYHYVPATAVLSDALIVAGGTTSRADLAKLRLERAGRTLWDGRALQHALADGITVDGAWLRHGDRVIVGARRDAGIYDNLRFLWILVSLAGGIYGLSRAF